MMTGSHPALLPQPLTNMTRSLFCAAILLALVTHTAASQQGSGKQVVVPGGQGGSGILSPAVRAGNMVYASGQLGMSRQNPDSTIEGQTRLTLENTRRVLEAAGTTMDNVVKCTVFLTRASDFQGMNRVYREFFPKDPPARSTVVVAALVVPAALVEIECIAAMPQ
jgi:2-iminobutanoate/2-iminopropanoate deaminase